jgi:hypothetical protein
VVGGRRPLPPGGEPDGARAVAEAAARRRARLDARLAVYARYAATVAAETEAALHGAGDQVRTLAERRLALEEQWRELGEAGSDVALPFDAALAGALHELDGQGAVELALRQRLAALHGTGAPGAPLLLGAGVPPHVHDALARVAPPHPSAAGHIDVAPPSDELVAESRLADADAAARAGALGEAVAGTLGGPLGRVYPGVVTRADPTAYGAGEAGAAPPAPGRLDVRF